MAPGCPRFGNSTVIDRPGNATVPPGEGIRLGMHKPRRGGHRVVWWDPALLEETTAVKPGIRLYHILQAGEDGLEQPGQELYEEWRSNRESIIEQGSRTRYHC